MRSSYSIQDATEVMKTIPRKTSIQFASVNSITFQVLFKTCLI